MRGIKYNHFYSQIASSGHFIRSTNVFVGGGVSGIATGLAFLVPTRELSHEQNKQ